VRQSGTTARFITALALAGPGTLVVDGAEQIQARPMGPMVDALRSLGITVEGDRLPLRADGGPVSGGTVSISGDVSSQFLSGLLLVAPLLEHGLTVEVTTPLISRPYLDVTIAVMEAFGATIESSDTRWSVAPGGYEATEYDVEPDASAAAYFFAAAAMTGGRARVRGLHRDSLQGDVEFVDVLERMGCAVEDTKGGLAVQGPRRLSGVNENLRDLSDVVPTFAAVAACADGPSRVRGVGFIRDKESDRIGGVVTQLGELGIVAQEHDDGFTVQPGPVSPGSVDPYDDHRMAMAFSLLGLVADGVTVTDSECVAKTFPRFYKVLDGVAATGAPVVIAIDGPAGSGKSTVARAVAEALDVGHLDTGAMYRAVAWAALDRGVAIDDHAAVTAVAEAMDYQADDGVITADGVDVTAAIRSDVVNGAVSVVAAHPGVRTVLRAWQRDWVRRHGGGVAEGRDMGTVVFPDATLKVFLTASAVERARRRAAESGDEVDVVGVAASIERRDRLDSQRADSPLAEAADAVVVDTSDLSVDEVVAKVQELLL
jgi:3-phosphoshikimate 1-carboxyvinyltransferase